MHAAMIMTVLCTALTLPRKHVVGDQWWIAGLTVGLYSMDRQRIASFGRQL